MSKYEYSGVTTKAGGYNSLGCYQGQQGTMAPVRGASNQMGSSSNQMGASSNVMVIPNYSAIGYDALTKGDVNLGNSKPYFTIGNAYGLENSSGSSSSSGPSYSMRNYSKCEK